VLEIDDPATEDVEAALPVEAGEFLIEGRLDTLNPGLLEITDHSRHESLADTAVLVRRMHHQVEEKGIRYTVAEHRDIGDQVAVLIPDRVVGVVPLQDTLS